MKSRTQQFLTSFAAAFSILAFGYVLTLVFITMVMR